jgi:F420-non-reducing hydrogenase iron-sulfur subunit
MHQQPTSNDKSISKGWQPKIVAFFCNWCTYTAADLAGVSRLRHAPNVRIVRLMCSGRVDPQFVLEAFAHGADGVLIGGCHPGDCHYGEGNYKALRRYRIFSRMLQEMGIEKDRFRLEWISAAEGEKVKSVINDMVGKVKSLGPLGMNTELKQRIDESAEPNESIHEITLKEEVLNHA